MNNLININCGFTDGLSPRLIWCWQLPASQIEILNFYYTSTLLDFHILSQTIFLFLLASYVLTIDHHKLVKVFISWQFLVLKLNSWTWISLTLYQVRPFKIHCRLVSNINKNFFLATNDC